MTCRPSESTRKRAREQGSDLTRGAGRKLLAAILLFLLCFGGKQLFPERAAAGSAILHTMLTSSSDFESAFAVLGDDLAEGKGLARSVGNWCVTVFSPEPITVEGKESSVPTSAVTEERKANWLDQVIDWIQSRLPSGAENAR